MVQIPFRMPCWSFLQTRAFIGLNSIDCGKLTSSAQSYLYSIIMYLIGFPPTQENFENLMN